MPPKGQLASADPGPGNYAPKSDGGIAKPFAPQWRLVTYPFYFKFHYFHVG